MKVLTLGVKVWLYSLLFSAVAMTCSLMTLRALAMDTKAFVDGNRDDVPSAAAARVMKSAVWVGAHQPGVALLKLIPGISWIGELSQKMDRAYHSGVDLIANGGESVKSVRDDELFVAKGQLNLQLLNDLQPRLEGMNEALDQLGDVSSILDDLPGSLEDRVLDQDAREQIQELQEFADSGLSAAEALVDLVQQESPSEVFVAITNPAEKRGLQGIIGQYASFSLTRGRVSQVAGGSNADLVDPAALPQGLSAGYESLFGDGNPEWVNMTLSPFAPDAAIQMASAWEQMGNKRPDAVVIADLVALGAISESLGKTIRTADGTELRGASEIANYLANGIYFDFLDDNVSRKEFQTELQDEIINAFLEGMIDPEDLVPAMRPLIQEGRLALWFDDLDRQKLLSNSRIAQSPDSLRDNSILIAFNNVTGNKMDFYVEPTIQVEQCSAKASVLVTLENMSSADVEYPDYVVRRLDLPGEMRRGARLWATFVVRGSGLTQIDSPDWSKELRDSAWLAGIPALQTEAEVAPGEMYQWRLSLLASNLPRILLHPFIRPMKVEVVPCSGLVGR